jgi:cardiolipin synthase
VEAAVKKLDLLANTLCVAMSGLRVLRVPPVSSMTRRDVRSNASGLSYAILATRWQKRLRQPEWESVYAEWERLLPSPPAIDPLHCGVFDARDRFELLTSNAEAFAARYRLFDSAQRSLDITTYYIQADATGKDTVRRLVQCARRGVRVRMLVDGIATARKAYEDPEVTALANELRGAGVDYRVFHDPRRPFDASHRKLLIVDETTLITGGRNFADHYSGTEWRDIDLMLTGPSVRPAQEIVERTFAEGDGYGVNGGPAGSGIFQTTTPAGIGKNASFVYLLQCAATCRETLDIENAYYINHPILFRELVKARKRGVRVRILTNSAESNDLDFTNYRIYSGFPELLEAGIELHVRTGKGRTLHCKYFVSDGEWVGFGSSNLDYYSPRFCGEAGIHVRSTELAGLLSRWFDEGLQDAERTVNRSSVDALLQKQTVGRVFDSWFQDIQ